MTFRAHGSGPAGGTASGRTAAAMRETLSVVIPTLQAAATLPRTIASVASGADEIIVSDCGSSDGTGDVARRMGATVVTGRKGRGPQLNLGAATARGEWLLFLHADTALAPGWTNDAAAWMARDQAREQAAVFRFALDAREWQARVLERLVSLRVHLLALPYGDQGLLIHRTLFDRLGLFRPIAIMEDLDAVRAIGRRRLTVLPSRAVTSARKWREEGWLRRSGRNMACAALYRMGISPDRIAALYGTQ
ncbi:TIGR04283 family arsenosugar biosynthesis glycosyltransferase [Novosphingobium beihaiensis]|uniref:TIGR04283 family arsenosugar biosynthesis glycosyltransferase n=1 Tax=Novosphingobium beihaiensis TaxID=2930389 RepID=A0ABT0BL75_9SPHN|nr:TIGR04283 family arsenosugar biosynthesis glycosyltransferase [Novosphingobium beihaiensis]MCJ2185816.1 TIGR04283 family arsenosugar biosynthesis glycosyltransferase [Novosphingobium beihaiensis]